MTADHILQVIGAQPGIQRDGTQFNSKRYIDGQWVRFYMDLPGKIGGYTQTDPGNGEIIRNMFEVPKQNSIDLYLGRASSLKFVNINQDGVAGPEIDRTPSGFVSSVNNQWTFDLYTILNGATPVTLGTNPITTDGTTGVVTVAASSTAGIVAGQLITISGATAVGGIPAIDLNITAQILSVVPNTSFTYTALTNSTSIATGGGTAVTYAVGGPVTYICAVATQSVIDINSNVESLIYWGNVNATTPLIPISASNQTTSGGIVVLYPYFFKYGNDGVVTFTRFPGGTWQDAVAAAIPVSGVKIVKGFRTRGGNNSPAGLFWSLDSLVRATFVGGATVFQFDNIQDNISVLSSNSICTQDNVFYWVGNKQFYFYNGVVGEIPNDTNKLFFYNNINRDQQQKCWAMVCPYFHELIIGFPFGGSVECTNLLFYEYQKAYWYDSVLARSSGLPPSSLYDYPIMSDANRTINPLVPPMTMYTLPSNPVATTMGSSVVVLTTLSTLGLLSGDTVTIANITSTGGLSNTVLNGSFVVTVIDSTTISYITTGVATTTTTGGGTAGTITFTSNLIYNIWTHEIGTDQVTNGKNLAINSYFTSNYITFFDQQPQDDRQMRIRRIEQDFIMTGNMSLVVNSKDFAQSPISSSTPYIFMPGQPIIELNKIDTINMGRQINFTFGSNVAGGNYQMGKILLSYAPGDVYP